jgi:hypothetical protein
VKQLTDLLKLGLRLVGRRPQDFRTVMIVVGDADGLPPSHAVEFFKPPRGGLRDAGWDRSGMTQHRLAILPGATHYDINLQPAGLRRR